MKTRRNRFATLFALVALSALVYTGTASALPAVNGEVTLSKFTIEKANGNYYFHFEIDRAHVILQAIPPVDVLLVSDGLARGKSVSLRWKNLELRPNHFAGAYTGFVIHE